MILSVLIKLKAIAFTRSFLQILETKMKIPDIMLNN